jgi:hypothetical protein
MIEKAGWSPREGAVMSRRVTWAATLTAIVLALAGGILAYRITAPPGRVLMDMSWAHSYSSLKDLRQNSDVVAAGHFSRVIGTTVDNKKIPFTDFEFTVDTVIRSNDTALSSGGTVVVHQTGAKQSGTVYESTDDPLFTVGENAVLFLHRYAAGHYYLIGGPTGRFGFEGKTGVVKRSANAGVSYSGRLSDFSKAVNNA